MNIAFFTDTYKPQINGVVSSIENTKIELEKLGHKVFLFAPKMKGIVQDGNIIYFRSMPYPFQKEHRIVFPGSRKLFNFSKLDIDIIHSHTPFSMGNLALFLAKFYKKPLIHTYHTFFEAYFHYAPFIPKFLTKRIAKRASKGYCNRCNLIIVPSLSIKKLLLNYAVKKDIEILPSGIDKNLMNLNIDKRLTRKKLSFSNEDKILLFVGRIAKEKNLVFILNAFEKLILLDRKFKLVIVGDGPEKTNLEKIVSQKGLAKNIIFTGYKAREAVFDYYAIADIFVFASKTETQGLVILEAMSKGLPIVALDAMGVEDVLNNQLGGKMTKENIADFNQAILDILKDEANYHKIAIEAKEIAKEFTNDKIANRLVEIYKKLLTK